MHEPIDAWSSGRDIKLSNCALPPECWGRSFRRLGCHPFLDRPGGDSRSMLHRVGRADDANRSDIGSLLQIALCGHVSLRPLRQASHFLTASSRLMHQCWLKYAARNLPLKGSMNALSVGLPSQMKASVPPCHIGEQIKRAGDKPARTCRLRPAPGVRIPPPNA